MDGIGLRLGQCLGTPADAPCALAGTFPNPAAPIVFPTNFPDEFFYMRATARIDGIGGGVVRADLRYPLQGALRAATCTTPHGAAATDRVLALLLPRPTRPLSGLTSPMSVP